MLLQLPRDTLYEIIEWLIQPWDFYHLKQTCQLLRIYCNHVEAKGIRWGTPKTYENSIGRVLSNGNWHGKVSITGDNVANPYYPYVIYVPYAIVDYHNGKKHGYYHGNISDYYRKGRLLQRYYSDNCLWSMTKISWSSTSEINFKGYKYGMFVSNTRKRHVTHYTVCDRIIIYECERDTITSYSNVNGYHCFRITSCNNGRAYTRSYISRTPHDVYGHSQVYNYTTELDGKRIISGVCTG